MIFVGGEQGFQKYDGRQTGRVCTDQNSSRPVFKGQPAVPATFKGQQLPPAFAAQQVRGAQK
jgi:hypothetical protein